MTQGKSATGLAGNAAAAVLLALCLTASVSPAQTPAQDESIVAADKQAVTDAQTAIKNDTLQLGVDRAAKNLLPGADQEAKNGVIQTDNYNLARDQLTEGAAEERLKADMQQEASDDAYFNGTPPAPPPGAPQAVPGQPGTPAAPGANPTGTTGTPASPAAPAGQPPAPAP